MTVSRAIVMARSRRAMLLLVVASVLILLPGCPAPRPPNALSDEQRRCLSLTLGASATTYPGRLNEGVTLHVALWNTSTEAITVHGLPTVQGHD